MTAENPSTLPLMDVAALPNVDLTSVESRRRRAWMGDVNWWKGPDRRDRRPRLPAPLEGRGRAVADARRRRR